MLIVLSHAAVEHITYLCNERAWRDTGILGPSEVEELRLYFVKACFAQTDAVMLNLTRPQLRALDTLLTDADPREGKLPDGTTILALVETVWRLLIGDDDAGDTHDHAHADQHAGADAGDAVRRP